MRLPPVDLIFLACLISGLFWSDMIARIPPAGLQPQTLLDGPGFFTLLAEARAWGSTASQHPVLEPGLQLTWILWTQDLKDFARQSGCDVVYSETGRNSNGEG